MSTPARAPLIPEAALYPQRPQDLMTTGIAQPLSTAAVVPQGNRPTTAEAFRAFKNTGIRTRQPRPLPEQATEKLNAEELFRNPVSRANPAARQVMRALSGGSNIPSLLDYEEEQENRINDLGDKSFTYAGKAVPNFYPRSGNEMPDVTPYSQMHKMTPDELERETNALNDWQQRQLDREQEEPEGSTEHYTSNPERYEFGEGMPHLAEAAAELEPVTRFRIQGDDFYDTEEDENRANELEFPSGAIYARTPLGMLQTGGAQPLSPEQRSVTERIRSLLYSHGMQEEGNNDSSLLDAAREFYHGLPPEAKGFRERLTGQSKRLAARNAATDLTKMTNEKDLKNKWKSIFDNALAGGMDDRALTELRNLYKVRKYELSNGSLAHHYIHAAGYRPRSGTSSPARDVSEARRIRLQKARLAAENKGTYADLTSKFGTGQKLEFMKQRRLINEANNLEGVGNGADYARRLAARVGGFKTDLENLQTELKRAGSDERSRIIREMDTIRHTLHELELRHKYATLRN
jgi:hypothetical protein